MNQRNFKKSVNRIIIICLAVVVAVTVLYTLHLDHLIRNKFDGKRWSLPAVVYARPLEIYPALQMSSAQLEKELQLAGYRKEKKVTAPGGYEREGDVIRLVSRKFSFPDGVQEPEQLTIQFSGNRVSGLIKTDSSRHLALARLDPAKIGSFHPRCHEDRIVITRPELPELLVNTLLAVEDRDFYNHPGLSARGIARALLANLKAGETVQGGSTLTQQLVKNFFLSNTRSLSRKFNEAVMSLLLEFHYSKDEILTAYTNEIFLGQDGSRAVHGFALASQFYFRRDLSNLTAAQYALLVGMVKGPSYYSPIKHPERCLRRRNMILGIMRGQSLINEQSYQQALAEPICAIADATGGFNRFPAFLDLIRRQLGRNYQEKDLTTDGLKILTTLDPQIQFRVEKYLAETVAGLEKRRGVNKIQGAVVVSRRENGEILAVAGGRDPLQAGFNRALDARRSIGSLIKPAVYLAALANGYTLADPVDDRSLSIDNGKGEKWQPRNFDRREHGKVPLYQALAHSYNLATIKIGMDVGLKKVEQTFKELGGTTRTPLYPSFLLGAVSMTPLDVSRMYQTIADGGFFVPQQAINTVLSAENKVVRKSSLSVDQRFSPELIYLLTTALQIAVKKGTGKKLSTYIPSSCNVAGKTGTSNNLRDSWFAGFTNNMLAVIWLGRDDNKSTGLTGATGALPVWGEIMRVPPPEPLNPPQPSTIEWAWINRKTFEKSSYFDTDKVKLPFVSGTIPARSATKLLPGLQKQHKNNSIIDIIRGWFH